MRTRRARAAGFTLIELMVSLVIASVLVFMMLSVGARLVVAFRVHQKVSSVQQVLSATRGALEHDARHAGLGLSQGFTIAADLGANRHAPVRVINADDGPDEVAFFYADPTVEAVVVAAPVPTATVLNVDDATGFAVGDLVVLSTPDTISLPNPLSADDATIAVFSACVLQIESIAGLQIAFSTAAPWGSGANAHCVPPAPSTTMMYRFVAHNWRIDPARPDVAALQLDPTGGMGGPPAFADQAYGVSDLQAATYFFDNDGIDTGDPDTDPARDWYSSDAQEALTDPVPVATQLVPPLMMSLSVVARTDSTGSGPVTASTPALLDPADVANNTIGDRPAVALPSLTDPALMGQRVYRHVTFQVDLRNTGVGR